MPFDGVSLFVPNTFLLPISAPTGTLACLCEYVRGLCNAVLSYCCVKTQIQAENPERDWSTRRTSKAPERWYAEELKRKLTHRDSVGVGDLELRFLGLVLLLAGLHFPHWRERSRLQKWFPRLIRYGVLIEELTNAIASF